MNEAVAKVEAPVVSDEDELAPPGETREERFHRIGERRMSRILKEFDLLENLSGPNYSFTEDEVDTMFDALESTVGRLKDRFMKVLQREAKQRPVFKF
jgi:hypothetical protein